MNKIFKCLLVAGIVAVSGYGINKSINKDTAELTGLTLANIEALADGEDDMDTPPSECYQKHSLSAGWHGLHNLIRFKSCDGCKYVWAYNPKRRTVCS